MQLVLRGSSFRIGMRREPGLRKGNGSPLGWKWEVGKAHPINQGAKRTAWVSACLVSLKRKNREVGNKGNFKHQ